MCFVMQKNIIVAFDMFGNICPQTDMFGELSVLNAGQITIPSEQLFREVLVN